MKQLLVLALLVTPIATVAQAEKISAVVGLGASYEAEYQGSDSATVRPWFIGRNLTIGEGTDEDIEGFAILPSASLVGERNAADYPELAGLNDIELAYELGGKIRYVAGPWSAFASLRKGFKGHNGLTGEIWGNYRTDLSDQVSLWSGVEFDYGNSDYTRTYFGVTPEESTASGLAAYEPGGGFTYAGVRFQASYSFNEKTALLGEVGYGRLIGDAADSPITRDEWQPSLKLGIVREFSISF